MVKDNEKKADETREYILLGTKHPHTHTHTDHIFACIKIKSKNSKTLFSKSSPTSNHLRQEFRFSNNTATEHTPFTFFCLHSNTVKQPLIQGQKNPVKSSSMMFGYEYNYNRKQSVIQ